MTRTESARLKSYGEAYAQKKLELHLAKEMSTIAEKRFLDLLQEIADRDDPPPQAKKEAYPIIFDYLEKIDEFAQPELSSASVIVDE